MGVPKPSAWMKRGSGKTRTIFALSRNALLYASLNRELVVSREKRILLPANYHPNDYTDLFSFNKEPSGELFPSTESFAGCASRSTDVL